MKQRDWRGRYSNRDAADGTRTEHGSANNVEVTNRENQGLPKRVGGRGSLPRLQKGSHNLPASYWPVCVLSHARKVVNYAILSEVNEQFKPGISQFRLQGGIAGTQPILPAKSNGKEGLKHAAILDLEKAYDQVERQKLLDLMAGWVDGNTVNMMRALLGPMPIRAKNDPSEFQSATNPRSTTRSPWIPCLI